MTKQRKKSKNSNTGEASREPLYPYVVSPKSLRRFLETAPQKPKPPKITITTLKTWGFKSGNDSNILRVLKKLDLLSSAGEPTKYYEDYMKPTTGAAVLGRQIQNVYTKLFEHSKSPEKASNDELKTFFNINSGGTDRTIQLQIDTFKALASFATFGEQDPLGQGDNNTGIDEGFGSKNKEPMIRIDLHIHLPENKSKSDYDAILESIANHIYKK